MPRDSSPASSPTAARRRTNPTRRCAPNSVRSRSTATASSPRRPCRAERTGLLPYVRPACRSPWFALSRGSGRADDGRHRNFRRSESAPVHARSSRPRATSRLPPAAPLSPVVCSFARDAPTGATERSQRLHAMHVSASMALTGAAATGGVHKLARRLDPAAGGGGAVRKLLDALVANQPATYEIASLADHAATRSAVAASRSHAHRRIHWGASSICTCIRRRSRSGRSDRPVASPLARLQARTRDSVTTLLHTQVRIADANALRLLPLVDGTRDRAALAAAVKQIAVDIDPSRAQDFVELRAREVRATWAADGRRTREQRHCAVNASGFATRLDGARSSR